MAEPDLRFSLETTGQILAEIREHRAEMGELRGLRDEVRVIRDDR